MKALFYLAFFLIPITLFAQDDEDVVYLENGSVLRGKIISSEDTSSLKIEILGGSIFVVDKADVKYIKKEPAKALKMIKGPVTVKQSGFWGQFNLGFPSGSNTWGNPTVGFSMNAILGYQYQPRLRFGAGSGFDIYNFGSVFVPMFLRVSGDFFESPISPIYFVDLGYSAHASSNNWQPRDHLGGLMTNIGGGLKFNTRRRVNFNVVASYKIQTATDKIYNNDGQGSYYEERYRYHRIEVKLALGF